MSCPTGFFCLDIKTLVPVVLVVVVFIYYQPAPVKRVSRESRPRRERESRDTRLDRIFTDRIYNPLLPPERTDPGNIPPRVPINVPTRGYSTGYQQVGILMEENAPDGTKKILPLYGEQTYRGSNTWKYYTSTDGFHTVKLPIIHKKKNCLDDYGCEEIYDGNSIHILAYEKPYTASLYKIDGPTYLPTV